MGTRWPTNQLIQPEPEWTRPTWPYTCGPGTLAACAAPELTAPRMSSRRADMDPGSSAAPGLLAESAASWVTCGMCQLPESTAAATIAIDSGLTRTLPWPIVSAARSASPAGTGSCDQSDSIPKVVTTWSNWLEESRSDMPAKAVPQSSAKSALNGFSSPVPAPGYVCPPAWEGFWYRA